MATHPAAWGVALALHLGLAAVLIRPAAPPIVAGGDGLQVGLSSGMGGGGGATDAAAPDPLQAAEPQALPQAQPETLAAAEPPSEPAADPLPETPEAVPLPPDLLAAPPQTLAEAPPPSVLAPAPAELAPTPPDLAPPPPAALAETPPPEDLATHEPGTVEARAPLPVPPPPAPPPPAPPAARTAARAAPAPRPAPRQAPPAATQGPATAGPQASGPAKWNTGAPGPAPGTAAAGPAGAATGPRPLPPAYSAALVRILQRNLRYPPSARDQGVEGTAMLRFTIGRDGTVQAAQLLRGTGSTLLDHEALALLRRVSPLPRLPADFPDAQVVVTAPVGFVIR
ncbi:TonB family protein [Falsiroseomonas sp. HC035]|uniref:energy transducer TonB n=1 Tax=Falsiroseomonas sp. HC035 TaxID=3390999 RepID=UPI003D317DB8